MVDLNTAVLSSSLVGLTDREELLTLILSHSEYELRNRSKVSYNWAAIEQEARAKYLYSKYRINCSRDQLPAYAFREDQNTMSRLSSLRTRQVCTA